MKRIISLIFIMIFSTVLLSQEHRFIEVSGVANLEYPADQINWSVSIKKVENTLEKSSEKANEVLKQLLIILNQASIDGNDIQISPTQKGKEYENEFDTRSRKFIGFYTMINVNFILRDMNNYSDLVSLLSSTDELENILSTWSDSEYEEHHKSTLIQASDNARNKAKYLAENLGMKIGSVLEIQEGTQNQLYPNPFNTSSSMEYKTPQATGKIPYTRSVKIKFELSER